MKCFRSCFPDAYMNRQEHRGKKLYRCPWCLAVMCYYKIGSEDERGRGLSGNYGEWACGYIGFGHKIKNDNYSFNSKSMMDSGKTIIYKNENYLLTIEYKLTGSETHEQLIKLIKYLNF